MNVEKLTIENEEFISIAANDWCKIIAVIDAAKASPPEEEGSSDDYEQWLAYWVNLQAALQDLKNA